MLIQREHPVRSGVLWGSGIALVIGLAVVVINCIDIFLSRRLSYSEFEWSGLHAVAWALVRYGLFNGFWTQLPDWSTFLNFGLEWFVLTMGAYCLIGRQFPTAETQRKYVLGFLLAFLVANLGITQVVRIILFVASVLKFGFV